MSDIDKMSRKVSETNRSFKQTSFCEKGLWYSSTADPH